MTRTKLLVSLPFALLSLFIAWKLFDRVEITNAHPRGSNIIAFGDSLTQGVGAGPGEDYPRQLSAMAGVPIINRGTGGITTGEALAHLDRDVLNDDPRIVIVLLGGNDLLHQLSVRETFRNLDTIVTRIQEKGALVILVGIKGLTFADHYGSEYKTLAWKKGAVFVPNILHGIIDDPRLKSDQFHPNGAGYKIMAERILKALQPYLRD
jgi:acyl-CoA thioesterase I